MKSYAEWYPIFIMLAIDFAFAISNILLKKIILDGMNHLVFITYRQSISTIFLAPVAFFLEKYEYCLLELLFSLNPESESLERFPFPTYGKLLPPLNMQLNVSCRNTRPKLTPQILCNLFLSAIIG